MTIREAIDRVNRLKPGQEYTDAELVKWLSELDGNTYMMLIRHYEQSEVSEMPQYAYAAGGSGTPMDTVLMIPEPYCEIYVYYLSAMIALWQREITAYANDMSMMNTLMDRYVAWYMSTHRHLDTGSVKGVK